MKRKECFWEVYFCARDACLLQQLCSLPNVTTSQRHRNVSAHPFRFSSDKSRRQIYLKPWFPNLVKCHALHMKLALLFPVSYSLRTKHARSISTRKHLAVSVSSRRADKLRRIDGAPGTQPRDADWHVGAHCYCSHHQIHSLPLSRSHRSFTGTVLQYVCAPFACIQWRNMGE